MRCQHFQFGSVPLVIWTACDIDPLLNALVEKPDHHPDVLDERMPYWAELWPSSLFMAETIIQLQQRLPRGPWLELGCGPGLPGILAARLGLSGVCSDYMPEALLLARLNACQNACGERVACKLIDWRTPDVGERFNWIIAGDVAYEKRNFKPLAGTFAALLEPDGEIWLAEPGRQVAKDFFSLLEAEGWRLDTLGQQGEIRIRRLRRAA